MFAWLFTCLNEKVLISLIISPKLIPKDAIINELTHTEYRYYIELSVVLDNGNFSILRCKVKHFTYEGSDQVKTWFYQWCCSYVFFFVLWYLLGKELTHISICVRVMMNPQNIGTIALLNGQDYDRGVRQPYGWRIS